MAVVTQDIRVDSINGTHTAKSEDSISRTYRATFDADIDDTIQILGAQRSFSGSVKVPQDGAVYSNSGDYLFAKNFVTNSVSGSKRVWDTVVTWGRPDLGQNGDQLQPNPFFRPPIFNIEFIETEYPIELAENLIDLPHGGGSGGNRPKNTIGDLVNAAGKRPDEPQLDTERNAVLVIERNYASLAEIVAINNQFKRTTNSDSFQDFAPETLKYMVTDSLGERTEGEYVYYPGVTRIEQKKSTQRIIVNDGYAFWDDNAKIFNNETEKYDPIEGGGVWEGKDNVKDLWNLRLDGTRIPKGVEEETWIPYRYLNMVPYAPLVV